MNAQDIFNRLVEKHGDAVSDFRAGDLDPCCFVQPWSWPEVARTLRDDPQLRFDFLDCVTGVDWPDKGQIHVVFHLFSYVHKHAFVVKAALDRADPVLPSVVPVWSVANWQERECYDLLGVIFEGHPDLRRVLLPPDWEGYPLRKDYEESDDYHGIPTTRPVPLELLKSPPAAKPS
ncbi:MAG: NADH-quinone oxidoreductase subunit C [Deltaproteobacteria bacterium]|nr:NADH-quinone oxidoreductase subunit C [Deltaproteobacteria bacterium]